MARYIDADALIEPMKNACMGVMSGCEPFNEPLKVLESAPTADVVQVVRCKDCKWYEEQDETIVTCLLVEAGARIDGFCAWGEIRNDGEDA